MCVGYYNDTLFALVICEEIFQAVWQRMDGQGFNRSHIIPEGYEGNSVEYILGSPTTVVYLAEIENWKKNIDVKYTTISGAVL